MGQFPWTSFGNSKNQKISKRKQYYVLLYVHINSLSYIEIQITLTFASLLQGVLDYWDLNYVNAPNTKIDKIFNL